MRAAASRRRMAVALALLAATGCGAQTPDRKRSMSTTTEMDFQPLGADLVPWIADPGAHLAVVTVLAVSLQPMPGEVPATLAGTLRLRVVEVVASPRLAAGDVLEVPARQVADVAVRDRNAADHWNVLDLVVGRSWLLAARLGPTPPQALALAALALQPGTEGERTGLRSACDLEAGVRRRQPDAEAFVRALAAPSDTLHRYALDALARRQVFGRERGAELLERGLQARLPGPASRRVEAATLVMRSGLFAGSRGADSANVRVLALLAAGLVQETDAALALRWARLLAAASLSELSEDTRRDAQLRSQLLAAVKTPPAADVLAAIERVSARADESTRARLQQLSKAWHPA